MKLLAVFCVLAVLIGTPGCTPDIPSAQPFNADLQAESNLQRARVNSMPASNVDDFHAGRGQAVSKTVRSIQE